ncbi:unnamed protein product [Prorocentrum cordatum]|uniref:Hexosyltransferase n=1 Tax=Prorocentrum cordatum TaxID=2364126 RepID=A0ABN9WDC1_9DINO|nr:unnamed protein product [Polarella glacialis]
MPQRHKDGLMFDHWEIAWWKLQIWNLTQFEKLIWLDSDAILTRSIDWLFDRPWMWSQRDDWFCDLNVPKVCSGIVLIYPDEKDFEGLLKYAAEESPTDWIPIARPMRPGAEADPRQPDRIVVDLYTCIGTVRSGGYQNTNDHYSNMCFSHRLDHQLFTVGDENLNMCHFHPLAAWWRMLFCEAVTRIGLSMPDISSFCSDECWYQGKTPEYDGAQTCGPLSTTINYDDYVAKTAARPFEG